MQDCQEPLEVPFSRGGQERVDDPALRGDVGIGDGVGVSDATACAARELPCRLGRTVDQRADLVEQDAEGVVQDECEALGRGSLSSTTSNAIPTASANNACCSSRS